MICLFVIAVSTAKPTEQQLLVQKLDRSQCEHLLNVHGKPEQYMLRESTKVLHQFNFHIRINIGKL